MLCGRFWVENVVLFMNREAYFLIYHPHHNNSTTNLTIYIWRTQTNSFIIVHSEIYIHIFYIHIVIELYVKHTQIFFYIDTNTQRTIGFRRLPNGKRRNFLFLFYLIITEMTMSIYTPFVIHIYSNITTNQEASKNNQLKT